MYPENLKIKLENFLKRVILKLPPGKQKFSLKNKNPPMFLLLKNKNKILTSRRNFVTFLGYF